MKPVKPIKRKIPNAVAARVIRTEAYNYVLRRGFWLVLALLIASNLIWFLS